MSDKLDDKLDTLLRSRRVEPAGSDLTQRIILRAQRLPQTKTIPFWQSVRELFSEFHLPEPAYILASALILGMMIGLNAPQEANERIDDVSAVIPASFLAADEALLWPRP